VSEKLSRLIEAAKQYAMSASDKEEQRRSFAHGNANIEDERVTRETVDKAAAELSRESGGQER
jgi:hypothetical protein